MPRMEVGKPILYNEHGGGGTYEHLDFAVCSVAGGVDRRIHRFSRSRRADPSIAGLRSDFPHLALRTGGENSLRESVGVGGSQGLRERTEWRCVRDQNRNLGEPLHATFRSRVFANEDMC